MSANKKQYILLGAVVVIAAVLFAMGYKTSGSKTQAYNKSKVNQQFNIDAYLDEQTQKQAAPVKQQIVSLVKNNSSKDLSEVSALFDSLKVPLASAYYLQMVAQKENNELTWLAAGNRFYNTANFSSDSLITQYSVQQAKAAYQKVLAINSGNLSAKNALAVCIIQGDNDVMKGVGLLKEVVAVDSINVQAIFTLGMLSIQSNQLDKAQERFEKLISIEPFNPEYYFYLGEVYAKSNQVKKAVKTYETCKTLVKDAEAKKEIDNIITKLTNL